MTGSEQQKRQGDPEQDDCWNRTGVYGDQSCEHLEKHAHCRNCEVFGAASGNLMRRALPPGYLSEWTAHYAKPEEQVQMRDRAALVFRMGSEWLALPASAALAVAEPAPARRLPHSRDPALLGIANIRGTLYPCLSLARLLDIDDVAPPDDPGKRACARLLAIRFAHLNVAIPVTELLGIHRYAAAELETPPATLVRAYPRFVTGVLHVGQRRVGCLDADLLGQQLTRRIR